MVGFRFPGRVSFLASSLFFRVFLLEYGTLLVAEDRMYPLNGSLGGLRGFSQLLPLLLPGSATAFLEIDHAGYPSVPWLPRCA